MNVYEGFSRQIIFPFFLGDFAESRFHEFPDAINSLSTSATGGKWLEKQLVGKILFCPAADGVRGCAGITLHAGDRNNPKHAWCGNVPGIL